jgi:hypothetical protein
MYHAVFASELSMQNALITEVRTVAGNDTTCSVLPYYFGFQFFAQLFTAANDLAHRVANFGTTEEFENSRFVACLGSA